MANPAIKIKIRKRQRKEKEIYIIRYLKNINNIVNEKLYIN